MEGFGRPLTEIKDGSDDVTNAIQCDQCQDYGRFGDATTFCSDCTDYLCNDCTSQHRMLRVSKNHILLEGTAMPTKRPDAVPKEMPRDCGGDECPEHRGKLIELYCHSDHALACVVCVAESHRACKDVKSISKLSNDLEQFRELKGVKMTAKKQEKNIASCRKDIQKYRINNGDCYDHTVGQFEAIRSNIESNLDLLRERVYGEAGELKERNEKKLDSLSESLKSVEQELASLMADIETKENMKQMDQLFIAVKKMTNHIVENRQQMKRIKEELHIQTYAFQADPSIQQLLDKMATSNPLTLVSGVVKCTADIEVKKIDDAKDACVSGVVQLSHTDIVVADYFNSSIKLVDVDKKVIITSMPLLTAPRAVTVIPGLRVAVTLPKMHAIQYFNTTKRALDPCGRINVDGQCLAIESTEDTLIVSFSNPALVQMMDFKGHVKRTFDADSRGIRLFEWPGYLCLSPDHTAIYVSDERRTVVTCLSTDGQVKWKYIGNQPEQEDREPYEDIEDVEEGFSPAGLATDADGFLYICNHRTHSTYVVSPAGARLTNLSLIQCRLLYPLATCYSKTHNALYMTSGTADPPDVQNFVKRLSFR